MVVSQFFDAMKVGFLFSYVAPLLFVLVVTLFKEAMDDIYRFKQDKMTNEQEFTKLILGKNNQLEKKLTKSQDIQIGDIIEINQDERIPADMVILNKNPLENISHLFKIDGVILKGYYLNRNLLDKYLVQTEKDARALENEFENSN